MSCLSEVTTCCKGDHVGNFYCFRHLWSTGTFEHLKRAGDSSVKCEELLENQRSWLQHRPEGGWQKSKRSSAEDRGRDLLWGCDGCDGCGVGGCDMMWLFGCMRICADLCGCVGASPGRQQQPLDSSDFQTDAGIWGCTRKATATMPTFRTRRAGMDCPGELVVFTMFYSFTCFSDLFAFWFADQVLHCLNPCWTLVEALLGEVFGPTQICQRLCLRHDSMERRLCGQHHCLGDRPGCHWIHLPTHLFDRERPHQKKPNHHSV